MEADMSAPPTPRLPAAASEKQIKLLRTLGVPVPAGCTLEQASQLILRLQNARFYAWKLATQLWGVDLDGRALRPVIQEVLAQEPLAQGVIARVDDYIAALFEAGEDQPAPDLALDEIGLAVRGILERFHPKLAASAITAQAKPSVAEAQQALARFSRELEPRYFLAEPTLWERTRWTVLGAAVAAAALLLVLLLPLLCKPGIVSTSEALDRPVPAQEPKPAPSAPAPLSAPERPAPLPTPETVQPVPPEPLVNEPAVPPPGEAGAAQERKRVLAQALADYKLSDGRSFEQAYTQITATAAAKGLALWRGEPGSEQLGELKNVFPLQITVSWKKGAGMWTRLTPAWQVNTAAGTLTPSNEEARTFEKLHETLAP